MRFRIEQVFHGDIGSVEAAFVDPAFIERLASLPKLGKPQLLDQRVEPDRVHQRTHYAFAGDLNAAARAVLDPRKLTWVEEATLDRSTHTTTWVIKPDHYADRLECRGTFVLREEGGGGTRRIAEGDLRVHMALVGGRVEKAIVSGLQEHAAAEEVVLNQWLQESLGR